MARVTTSLSLLTICLALLSGCASGPPYSSVQGQIGPVASDKGRIFLYRSPAPPGVRKLFTSFVLVDSQPVPLDGKGVFFADLSPGPHHVWCSECIDPAIHQTPQLGFFETGQTINVNLMVGESLYVSFDAVQTGGRGLHFEHMTSIDPAEGSKEILDLPLIGRQ